MLTDNESTSYSIDLFDQIFYEGQSLAEWLYSGGDMRDEKRIIQMKFKKIAEVEKAAIQDSIGQLQNRNYQPHFALITFYHWTAPNLEDCLVIQNKWDCLYARRFYLHFADNISVFLRKCEDCFPQLFINDRVQQTIKRFKPFKDYLNELILHLTALNDHGLRLFQEYQAQNETVVLQHLSVVGNINCSAQGDPAYEKANLCFEFPSDQGGNIKIVCAPHTKLFSKHSGERIYFNWGHPQVKNGERLLIGHIGDHL